MHGGFFELHHELADVEIVIERFYLVRMSNPRRANPALLNNSLMGYGCHCIFPILPILVLGCHRQCGKLLIKWGSLLR